MSVVIDLSFEMVFSGIDQQLKGNLSYAIGNRLIQGRSFVCAIHQRALVVNEKIRQQVSQEYNKFAEAVQRILLRDDQGYGELESMAQKVIDAAQGTQWGYCCPSCFQDKARESTCIFL